ncbi:hypothetical protein AGMMS49983_20210 [Clostridia bacterium]|nr:hypothetical protein AGMMS49983_20210 [Clostridia bacterium]
MVIIDQISVSELMVMAEKMWEPLVKGVVDIKKGILVLDAGLHSDEELFLLDAGSEQRDLWGINLWPDNYGEGAFLEFDSLTNIRPRQNNRSRYVEDEAIREIIWKIVGEKVVE